MTILANVRDILQQYEHQHLVLRTDGRDIIVATVEPVAAELREQLDQLDRVTCRQYKVRGPVFSLACDNVAIVLLYIRINQYLFHRTT